MMLAELVRLFGMKCKIGRLRPGFSPMLCAGRRGVFRFITSVREKVSRRRRFATSVLRPCPLILPDVRTLYGILMAVKICRKILKYVLIPK